MNKIRLEALLNRLEKSFGNSEKNLDRLGGVNIIATIIYVIYSIRIIKNHKFGV